MKKIPLLAVLALPTAQLLAQDVLHYKVDEGCGSEAIQFAPSLVANGAIVTTAAGGLAGARIAGQFGQALSGTAFPLVAGSTTRINTGWAPTSPTGSFSFGMWIRNHPGNPTAIPFGYLFGATGGNFRLFTGSSGLLFLSSFPGSATSNLNLTTLLNSGWTHVACTVDGTALQATWYVNGAAEPVDVMTQPAALTGTNFAIGARDTGGSSPSPLDTDEFLFADTVWTAAEVLALAQAPRAADGDYDAAIPSQCGAGNVVLGSAGGTPAVGNLGYSLTVATTTPSLYVLLAGFDRCTYGGLLPLPLDGTPLLPLLTGCWILADAPVTLSGVVTTGSVTQGLPIPATVPVAVNIYTQALSLDLSTFASSMSKGFASSTGL